MIGSKASATFPAISSPPLIAVSCVSLSSRSGMKPHVPGRLMTPKAFQLS